MNWDWVIKECNGMHTNKVYYRDGTILGFGDTTNHNRSEGNKAKESMNEHYSFSILCKNSQLTCLHLIYFWRWFWRALSQAPPILRRRNLKTQQAQIIWICLWGRLGQGNHVIIYHLLIESEVITGKSQTEASIHQGQGLRVPCNDRMDEVNKLFIIWPFLALFL